MNRSLDRRSFLKAATALSALALWPVPSAAARAGPSPVFSRKTALPLRKARKSNALSDPNKADKEFWGRSWTVDILTNRMHPGYCSQTSRVAWEKGRRKTQRLWNLVLQSAEEVSYLDWIHRIL